MAPDLLVWVIVENARQSMTILDNGVDIFCDTESWLNPTGDDTNCADLAPPGYKTLSFPLSSRRGGIAFVLRDSLCVLACPLTVRLSALLDGLGLVSAPYLLPPPSSCVHWDQETRHQAPSENIVLQLQMLAIHPSSFSASQTLFSAKSTPYRYPRPFFSLNFHSAFLTSFTVTSILCYLDSATVTPPSVPDQPLCGTVWGAFQSVSEDEENTESFYSKNVRTRSSANIVSDSLSWRSSSTPQDNPIPLFLSPQFLWW